VQNSKPFPFDFCQVILCIQEAEISSSTGNYGCKGTKLALLQRLNAIPFCF